MVYDYKRKSNRAQWSEEQMQRAMKAVTEDKKKIREAARDYGIPYKTLRNHLIKQTSEKYLGRFRPTFSRQMEIELVDYILKRENAFFGITIETLRELAFQYAERNNVKHDFRNGKAGDGFIAKFRKRNPTLALRKPEGTSIARAQGFNRDAVTKYFTKLQAVIDEYGFQASDIYNADETGIRTSSTRPPRVIGKKGKKQIGVLTSAEKGQLVTVMACCSQSGAFIPPAIIFPRKRLDETLLDHAPPDTLGMCSDSGWMNSELFLKWLKFFVQKTRCSRERKVLLILDNHESHLSLDVLDFATENGVIMLSIPPHTTHKLQSLDVAVYGPFKCYFEQAVDSWTKRTGRKVTMFQMGGLCDIAYSRAATMENAVAGFAKTGITGCDIGVFTPQEFAAAEAYEESDSDYGSDRDEEQNPPIAAEQVPPRPANGIESGNDQQADDDFDLPVNREPNATPSSSKSKSTATKEKLVSPKEILPFPRIPSAEKALPNPRKKTATILSGTPQRKRKLELLVEKANETAAAKVAKADARKKNAEAKTKNAEAKMKNPKRAVKNEKPMKKGAPKKSARKLYAADDVEIVETSDSEMDLVKELDEDSETEIEGELMVGDFVVVGLETEMGRLVHYIARIDDFDRNDCEGVFLKREQSRNGCTSKFTLNNDDIAVFARNEIVKKLRKPESLGASGRRASKFSFPSLEKWDFNESLY